MTSLPGPWGSPRGHAVVALEVGQQQRLMGLFTMVSGAICAPPGPLVRYTSTSSHGIIPDGLLQVPSPLSAQLEVFHSKAFSV